MSGSYTERFTEVHQYGGELFPANKTAATYNTDWLSMANHQRAIFQIFVGTMAQGATLDFAVQQATDSSGTSAKALTPAKAITQLTQAGGDGDDVVIVEVRTEELDVNGEFDHIRGVLTIANAAVYCCVSPVRLITNYPPVPTTALTEVVT